MDRSTLSSIIECIVCLEIRREGPIYQCENGHNVCSECKQQIKLCPYGQCAYNAKCRNRTAEQLRDRSSLDFPCQFASKGCNFFQKAAKLQIHEPGCDFRNIECSFGCGETLLAKDFDEHVGRFHIGCQYEEKGCQFHGTKEENESHVKECPFRSVPCLYSDCKVKLPENEMVQHLKGIHKVIERNSDIMEGAIDVSYLLKDDLTKKTWKVTKFQFDNHDFVAKFEMSGDGLYNLWIQMIGPESEAKKYKANINVEKNGFKFEMLGGIVYSVDMNNHDVVKDIGCFNLSEKMVKQCMTESQGQKKNLGFKNKLNVLFQVQKKTG